MGLGDELDGIGYAFLRILPPSAPIPLLFAWQFCFLTWDGVSLSSFDLVGAVVPVGALIGSPQPGYNF